MNKSTLTPPISASDHIQGQDDSSITLVEYADYQCPYCGEAHPVIKRLQKSLGKKLRFVFRNFPLTDAHRYALLAACAAEAAGLQGKFWEMHDMIFENQDELAPEILPVWAQRIGLDADRFAKGLRDERVTMRIEKDYAGGLESGVDGTPSFFINGTRYEGEDDYAPLHAALLDTKGPATVHKR